MTGRQFSLYLAKGRRERLFDGPPLGQSGESALKSPPVFRSDVASRLFWLLEAELGDGDEPDLFSRSRSPHA